MNISNNNITIFGVIAILESLRNCCLKVKSSEIINQKKIMINNGELFCSLEACTNLQSLDTPLMTSVDSIETQYFSIYCKRWKNLKELRIAPYPWYQIRTTTVVASCLQNFQFLQVFGNIPGCVLTCHISRNPPQHMPHMETNTRLRNGSQ